jgi:hypothetical protein
VQAASVFTRALFSAPPGSSGAVLARRCQHLVTPAYLVQLASSPGAPALATVALPVVVTGVSASLDDWSPGEAGVAVGVSLHAGTTGPPSFMGLDVHLVAVRGAWLVDGMQL